MSITPYPCSFNFLFSKPPPTLSKQKPFLKDQKIIICIFKGPSLGKIFKNCKKKGGGGNKEIHKLLSRLGVAYQLGKE